MELTRRHRETLLSELDKLKNTLSLEKRHYNDLKKDNECTQHVEIHIILTQHRIEFIQSSLIDNEIEE
jgi:hypothetical protein